MQAGAAEATRALEGLLAPYGCLSCGVVMGDAGAWAEGELRVVPLADGSTLRLAHDEREAPVVLGRDGAWDDGILVSLTDEEGLAACAWAQMETDSPVVGLGIDVASRADFAGARGERFNPLLFTAREHELVPSLAIEDTALGYAFAFSAKEASFKCCAAPLRAWYHTHEEELLFDLRSFELADAKHETGTARRGEAQHGMDAMGIARVELARIALGDLALTLAVALEEVAGLG